MRTGSPHTGDRGIPPVPHPPERALVFCVDEKSQIQALDRSQPVLPTMPGVPQRLTHDSVRAGTTTLFAALEVATGKVVGSLHRRHRAIDTLRSLLTQDDDALLMYDYDLVSDPQTVAVVRAQQRAAGQRHRRLR